VLSLVTKPKSDRELQGLVYGVGKIDLKSDAVVGDTAWYRSPALLGTVALVLCVVLYLPFI
jgi:SSS family solute:Na+ symporter